MFGADASKTSAHSESSSDIVSGAKEVHSILSAPAYLTCADQLMQTPELGELCS